MVVLLASDDDIGTFSSHVSHLFFTLSCAMNSLTTQTNANTSKFWNATTEWLKSLPKTPSLTPLVTDVETSSESVKSLSKYRVYGHTYEEKAFSRLLSPGRVGDDFVNMSVIGLMDQVRRGVYSQVRPGVVITTSLLFNLMPLQDSWIHAVAARVFAHPETRYLLMPAYLEEQQHYFALVIDKEKKEICIGALFETIRL
jgi:hypothetical protein